MHHAETETCWGGGAQDNFHKAMKRMNMGIPNSAVNDLMHYFDTDDEGFISMSVMAPTH